MATTPDNLPTTPPIPDGAPAPKVDPPKAEEPKKTPGEWFTLIQDFADKLTLKRILLALFTGVIAIAGVLGYENRDAIFSSGIEAISNQSQSSTWDVSAETRAELTNLVRVSPLVKFALVTEVDLQKNRRIPRWWYLDDPEETQIRIKASTLLAQPVFDYDPKNTAQMVSVLNNEFMCTPYADTVYQRLFPDLGVRMPAVCRLAIPPFYGRFAGILTFGLEVLPSKSEQDSLRLEASRIAVEIYLRDVVKKTVPGPVTAKP